MRDTKHTQPSNVTSSVNPFILLADTLCTQPRMELTDWLISAIALEGQRCEHTEASIRNDNLLLLHAKTPDLDPSFEYTIRSAHAVSQPRTECNATVGPEPGTRSIETQIEYALQNLTVRALRCTS